MLFVALSVSLPVVAWLVAEICGLTDALFYGSVTVMLSDPVLVRYAAQLPRLSLSWTCVTIWTAARVGWVGAVVVVGRLLGSFVAAVAFWSGAAFWILVGVPLLVHSIQHVVPMHSHRFAHRPDNPSDSASIAAAARVDERHSSHYANKPSKSRSESSSSPESGAAENESLPRTSSCIATTNDTAVAGHTDDELERTKRDEGMVQLAVSSVAECGPKLVVIELQTQSELSLSPAAASSESTFSFRSELARTNSVALVTTGSVQVVDIRPPATRWGLYVLPVLTLGGTITLALIDCPRWLVALCVCCCAGIVRVMRTDFFGQIGHDSDEDRSEMRVFSTSWLQFFLVASVAFVSLFLRGEENGANGGPSDWVRFGVYVVWSQSYSYILSSATQSVLAPALFVHFLFIAQYADYAVQYAWFGLTSEWSWSFLGLVATTNLYTVCTSSAFGFFHSSEAELARRDVQIASGFADFLAVAFSVEHLSQDVLADVAAMVAFLVVRHAVLDSRAVLMVGARVCAWALALYLFRRRLHARLEATGSRIANVAVQSAGRAYILRLCGADKVTQAVAENVYAMEYPVLFPHMRVAEESASSISSAACLNRAFADLLLEDRWLFAIGNLQSNFCAVQSAMMFIISILYSKV